MRAGANEGQIRADGPLHGRLTSPPPPPGTPGGLFVELARRSLEIAAERDLARVMLAGIKPLTVLLIAHKIADLRERHHMTQAELARRLHTRQQVVSRMEQDKYRPSLTTLEKIARVFGKRLDINFI